VVLGCKILETAVDGERAPLGLLVDAVTEVVAFKQQDIVLPPQFGSAIPRDFIRGMGKSGGVFVSVIQSERAFDIEEMAMLTEQVA
jgi:purine-binding chemotaxis protein CheW